MEDDTIIPASETVKPSQRQFLLTAIVLLATLIVSTLCVIGVLLVEPQKEMTASQTSTFAVTLVESETEATSAMSPSATARTYSPTPTETPASEISVGDHKIVDYAEPTTGARRIIVYVNRSQGTGRIITYEDQRSTSGVTESDSASRPRRIISYDDAN